ncbi:MAG: MCE family protein [Mycobacteriaceae bacterium]|nr:MCE family protein [Mycobacteriaceae bacterium]
MLAVAASAALVLAGCGATVESVPLPMPGRAGDGWVLHARFRDALNLPSRAHVKIGGSDVGVVTDITTENFVADARMRIDGSISLPDGTRAELRQATPLGDIYIALTLPELRPGQRMLRSGDTIDLGHTSAGASVEELMMSVSLLLNGGALTQAARITGQLNSMFAGRGPQLAHMLGELTNAMSALNKRTADIDGALRGLDSLAGTLNQRKSELGQAADTFPALVGVLADNNKSVTDLIGKVTTTMAALGDFADTTGPQFVSLFHSVQALMSGFTRMGDNLAGALNGLNAVYPGILNSMRGSTLAVAATVSFLDLNALTDPKGSRLPDGSDIPAFVGSLAQVLQKVLGRVTSPPRPEGSPAPPLPPGGGR